MVSGRDFRPSDANADARVVIVNQSFVDRVMAGRNPIGRRLRYLCTGENCMRPDRQPGAWHEIVGVVDELALTVSADLDNAGLYHPSPHGREAGIPATSLMVRPRGDAASYAARLQSLAAAVDPSMRLHDVRTMNEAAAATLRSYESWLAVLGIGGALVLLLSLAGIYSIMAVTVTRRTREIGIRVAIGADAGRIVLGIFSRTLRQVGIGLLTGTLLFAALVLLAAQGSESGGVGLSARTAALFAGYVTSTAAMCLLACLPPIRRALRVQPTEALKADA